MLKHILIIVGLSMLLQGCSGIEQSPGADYSRSSQNGLPVSARIKGSDWGIRILGIGTSPSEMAATDELYDDAKKRGYSLGNSQPLNVENRTVESEPYFLYPFIGAKKVTIAGDIFKYGTAVKSANAE